MRGGKGRRGRPTCNYIPPARASLQPRNEEAICSRQEESSLSSSTHKAQEKKKEEEEDRWEGKLAYGALPKVPSSSPTHSLHAKDASSLFFHMAKCLFLSWMAGKGPTDRQFKRSMVRESESRFVCCHMNGGAHSIARS